MPSCSSSPGISSKNMLLSLLVSNTTLRVETIKNLCESHNHAPPQLETSPQRGPHDMDTDPTNASPKAKKTKKTVRRGSPSSLGCWNFSPPADNQAAHGLWTTRDTNVDQRGIQEGRGLFLANSLELLEIIPIEESKERGAHNLFKVDLEQIRRVCATSLNSAIFAIIHHDHHTVTLDPSCNKVFPKWGPG